MGRDRGTVPAESVHVSPALDLFLSLLPSVLSVCICPSLLGPLCLFPSISPPIPPFPTLFPLHPLSASLQAGTWEHGPLGAVWGQGCGGCGLVVWGRSHPGHLLHNALWPSSCSHLSSLTQPGTGVLASATRRNEALLGPALSFRLVPRTPTPTPTSPPEPTEQLRAAVREAHGLASRLVPDSPTHSAVQKDTEIARAQPSA
ncbi:unnamed protein product [Rangifer tarandus platyrhynchus]|uniref:Uncharacterized protein n=2 Tax=Rangifer tarandus platyrhynchus TaxID=3082113 RepID=A0ABN8YKV3_RANTA|nr:unnamed protein product [Rangifer tarandus platyrhynchus]